MKQALLLISILFIAVAVKAQQDVTRFLGIPIDGTKAEMVKSLKKKGFKYKTIAPGWEPLVGEFNGDKVLVEIETYKDKVNRIIVCDVDASNERNIITKYNNLCYQFENNPKYISSKDGQQIPRDEDLDYGIHVEKKSYQAVYFQWPTEVGDSIIHYQVLLDMVNKGLINLPKEEREIEIEKIYKEKLFELASNKLVWFTILERIPDQQYYVGANRYVIVMYYENKYNKVLGEDL